MKPTLGPEGLSGGVVTVLREVVGSPFHLRLELSVSCMCVGNQEVSPGWAACQFLRPFVTENHNLGCLQHQTAVLGLEVPNQEASSLCSQSL